MALIKKEDGFYDSETNQKVNVSQEELNKLAVIDKEAIFASRLKDQFNLDIAQLNNIDKIANNARQTEKNKLYQEIEDAKNQVKSFEAQNQTLNTQMTQLEAKIEELKKEKTSGGSKANNSEEINTLKEEINKLREEKKTALDEQKSLFEAYKTDMSNLIKAEKLESFKVQAIASAEGRIIPELVVGNTEEEISLSVEKAKQKFEEITNKTKAELEASKRPKQSTNLQTDNHLTLNGGKKLSATDLANMSDEEYSKYRESLLRSAGSAV